MKAKIFLVLISGLLTSWGWACDQNAASMGIRAKTVGQSVVPSTALPMNRTATDVKRF